MFFDIEKTFPCPVRPTGLRPAKEKLPLALRVPQHKPKRLVPNHSGDHPEQTTIGAWREPASPRRSVFLGTVRSFLSPAMRGDVRGVERTPRCPVCVPG